MGRLLGFMRLRFDVLFPGGRRISLQRRRRVATCFVFSPTYLVAGWCDGLRLRFERGEARVEVVEQLSI